MKYASTIASSPRRSARRRGVALLLTLAVLALLAVIGFTLLELARLEKRVTSSYVDHVRAQTAARTGVDEATARLLSAGRAPDTFPPAYQYYGEDMAGDSFRGDDEEGEDPRNLGLRVEDCPLEEALRPSFMEDLNGDGHLDLSDTIEFEGRRVGVSGRLPGTHVWDGDFYSLRVEDCSSGLNVNMVEHPYLEEMLRNLALAAGLPARLGTQLYEHAPYGDVEELRERARLTSREFNILRRLLTVYSWRDTSVVAPVPLSERIGEELEIGKPVHRYLELRPRAIQLVRRVPPAEDEFPRTEALGPEAGVPVGRAPVNINTAPREVLIALLTGLSGFFINEQEVEQRLSSSYDMLSLYHSYKQGKYGSIGILRRTEPIKFQLASLIADALIAYRQRLGGFGTWQQFHEFCESLVEPEVFTEQQADVLRANFNPNTNLNDFNPDRALRLWVDKTDLLYHTTEFCFFPTGTFRVGSVARVLGKEGRLRAESHVRTVIRVYEIYRETTQQEFLHDFWKNERELADEIISMETGPGSTANRLSLTVFPENAVREFVAGCDYDGSIGLATIENRELGANFSCHFGSFRRSESGHRQILDEDGPYRKQLLGGTERRWKPGSFLPDGVYSELGTVPAYDYAGHNVEESFALSFWLKPGFFPQAATKTRVFLTWQVFEPSPGKSGYQINPAGYGLKPLIVYPFGVYCAATVFQDQQSQGGYTYAEAWDSPSIMAGRVEPELSDVNPSWAWEGGVATPCLNHRRHEDHDFIHRGGERWGNELDAGKWVHVGWVHLASADSQGRGDVPGSPADLLVVNGKTATLPFQFHTPDASVPVSRYYGSPLRLGENATAPLQNSAPDSTVDEVLVWRGANADDFLRKLAAIWEEGRYYREDDGLFVSRELDLSNPSRPDLLTKVLNVSWTYYVPESLPEASVHVSLARLLPPSTTTLNLPKKDRLRNRIEFVTDELVNPAGSLVNQSFDRPFRYILHFLPSLDAADSAIENLVFDDITIIYTRGTRVLSFVWVP